MLFFIIVLLTAAYGNAFAQHQPVSIPSLSVAQVQSLDPDKDIDQYLLHIWKTEQGLPQNSAWAFCQTRDGYLWIGTQEGLVRYDGIRFSIFNKENVPAMRSNVIGSLLEDNSGALWIGTRGGGVLRLYEGAFTCYSTQNGLSNDDVTSIVQDNTGALWIGTSNGLLQFHNGAFTTYTAQSGLSSNAVTALLQDRENALWIGTTSGLNLFRNGIFKQYTTRNGLSNDAITALVQDGNGRVWIGTNSGINFAENGVFKTYTLQVCRTLSFVPCSMTVAVRCGLALMAEYNA
jgi:ligand-binding sensor domain-containing protein